ncbi:MAG: hypothetical protein ACR2GD_08945 [Pyrinomonadaceae bacterium]
MNIKQIKPLIFGLLIFFQILCFQKTNLARPDLQDNQVFICGLNSASLTSGNLGVILPGKTGNRQLDTAIQLDVLELQKVFGVSARMFLLQEVHGPNALAVRKPLPEVLEKFHIPFQNTSDGMVFFGLNLINSQYDFISKRGYAIPSIMGHEYAHILQYKLHFPFAGKWQELHADFLAGWYTAHRSRFMPQNIRESMATFFDNGDNDEDSPQHHGSSQEREEAFLAGARLNLQNGLLSGRDAYYQGLLYVQSKGAK